MLLPNNDISCSMQVVFQGATIICRQIFIIPCYSVTDATGEVHNLITEQQFPAGVYRVEFDTKAYWKSEGSTPFHEVADVSTKCRLIHVLLGYSLDLVVPAATPGCVRTSSNDGAGKQWTTNTQ